MQKDLQKAKELFEKFKITKKTSQHYNPQQTREEYDTIWKKHDNYNQSNN